MGKQFPESQHHAVDEWKQQVDSGAPYQCPRSRGLVENDGRVGRRRGRYLVAWGVLLAVGPHGDAGVGQVSAQIVGRHDDGLSRDLVMP